MSAEIAAGAAPGDIVTPTRLLAGQMLVVAAIAVAGLWAATQWAAAMLAYQPELGAAWFKVGGHPVYRPWQILSWWVSLPIPSGRTNTDTNNQVQECWGIGSAMTVLVS